MTRRPLVLAIIAALLATPLVTVAATSAQAANSDIRINEVESNGDTNDWIELTNTGTVAVDVSGWILRDNKDTDALPIPAGTSIAPGGFYSINTG